MKLKRQLESIEAAEGPIDHPRTKRHKRGSSATTPSVNEDVEMANGASSDGAGKGKGKESVKEQGFRLYNAVRNARGKDDHILCHDFMRLPSKRQYADYYNLIKRPIALDEIKAQLDASAYPSLERVKQDFDTCFKNAKKYNMRDSQIWRDAKALHKIVSTEYEAIVGAEEDVDVVGSEDGGDGSDDDDAKGKAKGRLGRPTSLTRLIKTRMQKLAEKTDDEGRLMTEVFMELPPKKIYPIYYKTIKKLMCFGMIFKRIKRKEYTTIAEFAADVELVFSNALTFNEEHSLIWEDATALKQYFKQIMSDLPPPYALPEYSSTVTAAPATNGKLKLRLPVPSQTTTPATNGTTLKVKLPALASVTASNASSQHSQKEAVQPARPALPNAKQASRSPNIATRPIPQPTQTQTQAPQTSSTYLHSAQFSHLNPHQPQPQYQYHSQPGSQIHSAAQSISPSPLPATPTSPNITFDHPLRSVTLKTLPLGRTLKLDSSEGVRTWVLRLSGGETAVDVRDVRFSGREESEDEDEDMAKSGKINGQEKGEVIVKANGTSVAAKVPDQKEGEGVWEIANLKSGTNIVEVGETAGEIWRIVLQHIGMRA